MYSFCICLCGVFKPHLEHHQHETIPLASSNFSISFLFNNFSELCVNFKIIEIYLKKKPLDIEEIEILIIVLNSSSITCLVFRLKLLLNTDKS